MSYKISEAEEWRHYRYGMTEKEQFLRAPNAWLRALALVRKRFNLSLSDAANDLGIDAALLSAIERGELVPSIEQCESMGLLYRYAVEHLLKSRERYLLFINNGVYKELDEDEV